MKSKLDAYEAYASCDVPWIPAIPVGWRVQPAFANLREKQVRNDGLRETQVLSLSYGNVILRAKPEGDGLVPESYETYQIVDPGDIIIRPTDLQNDRTSLRVGFVRQRGIITSAYMCLTARSPLLPEYAYLLLKAYDFKKVFYGYGSGLRQNLDFKHIKRMPILVPPKTEQAAIVAFVKQIEQQFASYARIQQELSVPPGRRGGGGGLVGEYRERLIVAAVLGEIDIAAKARDSGNSDGE
jgi:type I restriction enzyme, S subunit